MGWDSCHAKYYKKGNVDRKAEVDEYITYENEKYKNTVLKSRMVGSVYYGAVECKNKDSGSVEVIGVVALTKVDNSDYFNFSKKLMEETMGPYHYDCPKSILNLLTPTDNENANRWRNKCREKLEKPKLSDLPIGTTIEYTQWNGEVVRITKMNPNYQFKRTWWYREENNTYMPSSRIPNDYKIIA